MANNVYIGMRYVPIFDGPWVNTKSYEPLVIVEYGNNTYTSKKPVPVGTLPTDSTYWALTGNYNGQISALNTRVDALETEVNENVSLDNYFKNKKIVIYGDSISSRSNSYANVLSNDYGLNITNRAVGGTFLTTPAYGGLTPGITTIQGATDLNNFDVCFIQYGTNDWQISRDPVNFEKAVNDAIDCFDGLSCEPIFILPPYGELAGGARINSGCCTIEAYVDRAIDVCESRHVKYINLNTLFPARKGSKEPWLENQSFYLHPSDLGAALIARVIVNGTFNTGKCFSGDYNMAGMVRTTNIADSGIVPASLHGLAGNVYSARSDVAIGVSTVKVKSGIHHFHLSGIMHTNDSAGFVVGLRSQNGSGVWEGCTAHDGNQIDIYGEIDGDTLFLYGTFVTTGVNTLYAVISDLSIELDDNPEPTIFNIVPRQTGVTIVNGGIQTVHDSALYTDPLRIHFTNAATQYSKFADAQIGFGGTYMVPAIVYDTTDPSNPYKHRTVILRNEQLICNDGVPAGTDMFLCIPPITNKSFGYYAL